MYISALLDHLDDLEVESVFYKVLSQNDRAWAWPRDTPGYSHQGGFVTPSDVTKDFFPLVEIENRAGKGFVEDRYYLINMLWFDGTEWVPHYQGNDWRKRPKFGRSYKDRDECRVTGGMGKEILGDLSPGLTHYHGAQTWRYLRREKLSVLLCSDRCRGRC